MYPLNRCILYLFPSLPFYSVAYSYIAQAQHRPENFCTKKFLGVCELGMLSQTILNFQVSSEAIPIVPSHRVQLTIVSSLCSKSNRTSAIVTEMSLITTFVMFVDHTHSEAESVCSRLVRVNKSLLHEKGQGGSTLLFETLLWYCRQSKFSMLAEKYSDYIFDIVHLIAQPNSLGQHVLGLELAMFIFITHSCTPPPSPFPSPPPPLNSPT